MCQGAIIGEVDTHEVKFGYIPKKQARGIYPAYHLNGTLNVWNRLIKGEMYKDIWSSYPAPEAHSRIFIFLYITISINITRPRLSIISGVGYIFL